MAGGGARFFTPVFFTCSQTGNNSGDKGTARFRPGFSCSRKRSSFGNRCNRRTILLCRLPHRFRYIRGLRETPDQRLHEGGQVMTIREAQQCSDVATNFPDRSPPTKRRRSRTGWFGEPDRHCFEPGTGLSQEANRQHDKHATRYSR